MYYFITRVKIKLICTYFKKFKSFYLSGYCVLLHPKDEFKNFRF